MKPIRVLHVNAFDHEGGAARAAQRIHCAERAAGMDSNMLVLHRREADPHVLQPLSLLGRARHRAKLEISGGILARQHTPTNPAFHSLNAFSNGLGHWINRSDFDVVNLHWLGVEMLSVEEIGRINKPLCWTMHDMWPFSGAEHYDDLENPGRFRRGYAPANRAASDSGPDLDAWVWRRKRRAWAGKHFQLISPSNWLAGCARDSALMSQQPCEVIANCLDTTVFKPVDRHLARDILNLSRGKRYILFGAMSSTSDPRKGFHLLQPALRSLAQQPGIAATTELLVFGAKAPKDPPDLGLPIRYLGSFHDDCSLALLYNAADVFVAPSLQDNLPNTLVESISCGTPCVAFSLGGMTDLIEPAVTGHLAEPGNAESLMRQLHQAISTPLDRQRIREKALREYAPSIVAARYQELYRRIARGPSVERDGSG